ncbi:MAG: rhodanese-like domain-containing protein [Prevotella sp.]|jgi:rhodanese-related sulfurtransferase
MSIKSFIMALFGGFATLTGCNAQDKSITTLEPQQFEQQMKTDSTAVLIDVRTAEEFEEGHLAGARNIDFLEPETFDQGIATLDSAHTYYIYCRSGKRSHKAALKMTDKGLRVVDMAGGILAWIAAGKETVKDD